MIEIENAFLASIIKKPENLDLIGKVSRDWFSANNIDVFDSIIYLFSNGKGIDQITISDRLKGVMNNRYREDIIPSILSCDFNPSNFETYQSRLEEEFLRRTMINELYESIKRIEQAEPGDIKKVVDVSEGRIFNISQSISSVNSLRKMSEVGKQVLRDVKSFKDDGVPPFISNTGFMDIDDMVGGFQAGDYSLLAATTSQGKTALSLQILRNNIADGRAVGMISLEMTSESMFIRHISAETRIDSLRIRKGNITKNEMDQCVAAWKRIDEMDFYINDDSTLNEVTVRGVARRMVKMYGIKLLVIDHIQEMDCADRRESRQQEMAKISRSLKNMAKELKIPILVLSQLSRAVVDRNPPIPRLSDLRESGALEQDSDNVIFIYRPEQYNLPTLMDGVTPSTNRANIIVGKARNGRTGDTDVVFLRDIGSFESVHRGNPQLSEGNDES